MEANLDIFMSAQSDFGRGSKATVPRCALRKVVSKKDGMTYQDSTGGGGGDALFATIMGQNPTF